MQIRKNVSNKERIARIVGGGAMILCGLIGLGATPLGIGTAGVGLYTLVTGLVRYCPSCAIMGRKTRDHC